jgi:hypothetical protein
MPIGKPLTDKIHLLKLFTPVKINFVMWPEFVI